MSLLKNVVIFTFALLASSFVAHERIHPERLDWDTHFKASPNNNSPYAAVTSTLWYYDYTATITDDNLHIAFNFIGGVDPSKSWVKRDKIRNATASNILLNHEQGHVYINFLLLQNGEKVLRNQRYTVGNYKRLVDKTAKEVGKYYNDLQDRYDAETAHGSNAEAQEAWNSFFKKELEL